MFYTTQIERVQYPECHQAFMIPIVELRRFICDKCKEIWRAGFSDLEFEIFEIDEKTPGHWSCKMCNRKICFYCSCGPSGN